jgi:hypothetical protein
MTHEYEPHIVRTLEREPRVEVFVADEAGTCEPKSLAVSPKHGLFVGDPSACRIYRIQHGLVTTLVSGPDVPVAGDVNDVTATSMAYDGLRNVLVVADSMHHVVREVNLNEEAYPSVYGVVRTLAGATTQSKSKPGYKDGACLKSKFRSPSGVCVTLWGDILVSDTGNHVIRLIRSERVSTFAGNGARGFKDGERHQARFSGPVGIVATAQGDIFVCDENNKRIRMIDESGEVSTLAGSGEEGLDDGTHLASSFVRPHRLIATPRGDLIVVGHHLRFIQMNGQVSTLAETTEPWVQLDTERNKISTFKRNFSERFLDTLAMHQHPPSKTIVTSKKKHIRRLKPSPHDPQYHIAPENPDFHSDPHCSFGSVADLVITPEGDLIFTDPSEHAIKIMPGLIARLYPLPKRKRPTSPSIASSSSPNSEMDPKNAARPDRKFDVSNSLSKSTSQNFGLQLLLRTKNPFFDYEITLKTQGGRTTSWDLHLIVLFAMCPSLVLQSTVFALSELILPISVIQALVEYLYSGNLTVTDASATFWAQFATAAWTVQLYALAQHACFRLFEALQFQGTVEGALELLQTAPMMTFIFDAISEFISSRQGFNSHSPAVVTRQLSLTEAYSANRVKRSKRILAPPKSDTPHPTAIPPFPPSYELPRAVRPTLRTSKSSSSLVGKSLRDIEAVAGRVAEHSRSMARDRKLHERNRVDVSDWLKDMLPVLGNWLHIPPPKKDSLVPFPELLAPDFYLHVGEEYVPCHGSILYARWPWFRAQVDQKDFRKLARPNFAPYSLSLPKPAPAPHTPARRLSYSLSSSAINVCPGAVSPVAEKKHPEPRYSPPAHLSLFESWSLRASKSFERERSVEIPPNTVNANWLQGFVWYLYSGETNRLPPPSAGLPLMAHAITFGFIDELARPVSPFEALVAHMLSHITKPITLDNCFSILDASTQHGYMARAHQAEVFIANHIGAITMRPDLQQQFLALNSTQMDAIHCLIPISRPKTITPPAESEISISAKSAIATPVLESSQARTNFAKPKQAGGEMEGSQGAATQQVPKPPVACPSAIRPTPVGDDDALSTRSQANWKKHYLPAAVIEASKTQCISPDQFALTPPPPSPPAPLPK